MTNIDEVGNSQKEQDKEKKKEKKCSKCGAILKKTEPTLQQVRQAIEKVVVKYKDDLAKIDPEAKMGYCGSIASGTVGNEEKPHYGLEPDIRGECGTKYDIDAFILSDKLFKQIKPDMFGKRWARYRKNIRTLEKNIYRSLKSISELAYLKGQGKGFTILITTHDKLMRKKRVTVMLID